MAGFRITYDGSLLGRSDVPQIASTESLTVTTTNSPAKWDNITALDANTQTYVGDATAIPNVYTSYKATAGTSLAYGGGNTTISGPADTDHIYMCTPYLPIGNWTYEIRIKRNSAADFVDNFLRKMSVVPRTQANIQNGSDNRPSPGSNWRPPNTFTTYFIPVSVTNSTTWLTLKLRSFAISIGHDIDYIRIYNSAGVTISDTTFTAGANPVGGSGVTPSVVTTEDGAAGTVGPAKNFGAIVEHNGSKIMEAKYHPPAETTQNAKMSASKRKIITATATDIVVKSEGVDATDKLGSVDTSIIVKDYQDATEN